MLNWSKISRVIHEFTVLFPLCELDFHELLLFWVVTGACTTVQLCTVNRLHCMIKQCFVDAPAWFFLTTWDLLRRIFHFSTTILSCKTDPSIHPKFDQQSCTLQITVGASKTEQQKNLQIIFTWERGFWSERSMSLLIFLLRRQRRRG